MHYPKYQINTSNKLGVFEFISVGTKGNIEKIIEFQSTENPIIFNLAFGDKKQTIKGNKIFIEIDDEAISENGDRDIVLATVVSSVFEYTSRYPERWVLFLGSNEVRTRLYRMAIAKNYEDLNKHFNIFGVMFADGKTTKVPFDSNTTFEGFIVIRKELKVL